jgi:two-component system cell cycle sensor histidine kinase/response regulator CckA
MDGTVLILDDDTAVLELTALYLNSRGFRTLTCHTAASALERLREAGNKVDTLIADVSLPDCSGVEIACQLKAQAPQLKILFVSGYSREELSRSDAALLHQLPPGSVHFLRKPFSAQELVTALVELLTPDR